MMTIEILLIDALLIAIGFVLGSILAKRHKPKYAGILRSYESDDGDGPYFYLDLDLLPEEIVQSEYVTFKVSRR